VNKKDFKKIKALFLDFDGVLTDDRVLVDENGKEAVFCSRSDGFGIERLKEAGVYVAVISRESNPVVAVRCEKLQIDCLQAINDKLPAFREQLEKRKLSKEETAFVGNDITDIECIKEAGIGIAVNDANPLAAKEANFVTSKKGGRGAVREIAELIIGNQEED
jgi:N-acylneuraminate cytidylyltransferase